MNKRYMVGVREVHVRHYSVCAENEEQAKQLVYDRAATVTDEEFEEYSNEMDRDTWSVEEIPDKGASDHNPEGTPS